MYTGKKADLSQDRLKQLMSYDPDTGLFTRIVDCNTAKRGDVVCSPHNQGYVRVSIDGVRYLVHRLAFLYMEGRMPDEIDHINGDRSDNRWSNLRGCSAQENKLNRKTSQKSGVKGVYWNKEKEKWQAQLSIGGKQRYLGRFDSIDEATELVQLAREEAHGEFARH